ncbi:hypothetical protein F2Q69_00057486 [Brassica cretica]|uniref:Uncharacterized protein n=1 Tax=Brassica cretica TaxID=69181 RepID=A0A8S9MTF0_BRACR|nr:hypothetical protein F2Q69_00057486 [Brassica cretica]
MNDVLKLIFGVSHSGENNFQRKVVVEDFCRENTFLLFVRVRQPRRPVACPSAYRRRWLLSLSFRSNPRVVVPICQVSLTCARIWVRVLIREEIGSLRLFFLWIRGEEVGQADLRFSVGFGLGM